MRHSFPTPTARHVLVVADWSIDPQRVLAEVSRDADVSLVVPAWLHGIDWVGDPTASVPCAERQLERLTALAEHACLTVAHAAVGDPDPLAAIEDAFSAVAADEILLFVRRRSLLGLALAGRAQRATGVPVRHIAVEPAEAPRARRPWRRVGAGHCSAAEVRIGGLVTQTHR